MGAWVGSVALIWLVQLTSLWGAYADDTCVRKPGQGPCMCTTTTNEVIDLSSIRPNLKPKPGDGKPTFGDVQPVTGFHDDYLYSYSPCTSFTEGSSCKAVAICQKSTSGMHLFGAGKLDTAKFSGDYVKNELRVTYTDDHRNSTVFLKCSPGVKSTLQPHGERPAKGSKHYEFILESKYACLLSPPHANGISTGSILLILFFVFVTVYLVGGTLLKHFLQGARGWEQIPNVIFWKDFPSLVRDGVMFTIGMCTPKRTYEAI